MKHLKIAGLCLAAMFVMSMVISATASAAGVWEQCQTEKTTGTKYETNQCEKASSTGKWSWAEITATEGARILAMTLTLTDEKATGGAATVRCDHPIEEGGEGSLGPKGIARITKAEVVHASTECVRLEGGCKAGEVEKVSGVNLPWQAELFETEKKLQTHIEATTSGKEPGWAVKCNTLLGSKTDECVQEAPGNETVTLENVKSKNSAGESELLVLGTFLKKNKAKCTEGGAKSGVVSGQLAILKSNGWGLRVS